MRIEEINQSIAQLIKESIEEDWQTATLLIDRLQNYTSVQGEYLNKAGVKKKLDDSRFGYLFSIKIHELHSLTTKGDSNQWNKIKFVLLPDSQFDIDFIWDKKYQDEINALNKKK